MSFGLFALTDAARSVVSLFRSAAMKMRARLGESCPPHKVLVIVCGGCVELVLHPLGAFLLHALLSLLLVDVLSLVLECLLEKSHNS